MEYGIDNARALLSRSARRRLVVDIVLLLCGIVAIITLFKLSHDPRLRGGILLLVAWQASWYVVRLVLMVGIWRRETALSAGRKVWLGLTMPIGGLFAIWAGRGALSAWLTKENAS